MTPWLYFADLSLAPSACWRAPLRHLATLCDESTGTRVFVQRAFGDGGETQGVAQENLIFPLEF